MWGKEGKKRQAVYSIQRNQKYVLKQISLQSHYHHPLIFHSERSQLETIIEESESRSSSQTSFSSGRRHRKEALSFSNKRALEELENEPQHIETGFSDLPNAPAGANLSFTNQSALDIESGKASEADFEDGGGDVPERGSAITTSFKKVVPMRSTRNTQPGGSPLMAYSPRGAIIPPNEVKGGIASHLDNAAVGILNSLSVPFSEDEATARKPAATAGLKLELGGMCI